MGSDVNYQLHMYRYIRNLEWDLIRIQSSESQSDELRIRKRYISDRIDHIRKLFQLSGEEFVSNPLLENGAGLTFADLQLKFALRPFQKDLVQPLELGRYLCLSVGYAVYCLDLKQSREDLPIISTVSMLEECFPISMGVFKLGSCAYMIAGKELSGPAKPAKYFICQDCTCQVMYAKHGVEGSSRETYRLSLADDRLSLYECCIIPPLNKTKYWPIVEKMGNHLHVIDTIPNCYSECHKGKTRQFSHEVLDLNDIRRGWTELSHPAHLNSVLDTHISQYIVVGDRIYACFYADVCLAFDSKTKEWERGEYDLCYFPNEMKHVSQIFGFGVGRCVAGVVCEELKDMYDVVFAVGSINRGPMVAAAYVVNKSGHVVCYNPLQNFFHEVKLDFTMLEMMVIAVDEEGSKLCVISDGMTMVEPFKKFNFISTFSFKEVANVVSGFRSSDGELGESNFIQFKDRECYVYDKGSTINPNAVVTGAFFC